MIHSVVGFRIANNMAKPCVSEALGDHAAHVKLFAAAWVRCSKFIAANPNLHWVDYES
jgi:hypothetical protein